MNLQWFDDLATVQETGHFSLAAQKLHISQPALSRRIKALEDWAGFALVDRRSRPVRLTQLASKFLMWLYHLSNGLLMNGIFCNKAT